jgi:copper chaperone CopZ
MTCAHIVNVALKKVPGVESVNVSLNKGLASVKLKPGNTVSVTQLWIIIHQNRYTPKATTVLVRGELTEEQGKPQLKVTGTSQVLALSVDPKNADLQSAVHRRLGQTAALEGIMMPAKDFKAPVPLQVTNVK